MQGHMSPDFLTVEDVLLIHAEQITVFGGESGLRDLAMLESAVAQPRQTFDSKYLHDSLFQMAAAYLFHLCQNHAFLDGNKRTALVAALVFLHINGVAIARSTDELYEVTLDVAAGRVAKGDVAAKLEELWLSATSEPAALGDNPGEMLMS